MLMMIITISYEVSTKIKKNEDILNINDSSSKFCSILYII